MKRGGRFIDLTGQRFGRLVVAEFSHLDNFSNACWRCICNCGKEIITSGSHLRRGSTKSCGCLNKENRLKAITKHGKANSKIYKTWRNMLDRCLNPNVKEYPRYGGRGIKICKRWMKFDNFYKDMGDPPKGLWIDRIDNDKGYSKKNCRWATPREQSVNRRGNHWITFNGKTQIITDWGRQLQISPETIQQRLNKGWSIEKTMVTPIQLNKVHNKKLNK